MWSLIDGSSCTLSKIPILIALIVIAYDNIALKRNAVQFRKVIDSILFIVGVCFLVVGVCVTIFLGIADLYGVRGSLGGSLILSGIVLIFSLLAGNAGVPKRDLK